MDDGCSIQATDPILFPFVILVKTWCYFGFTNSSLSESSFPITVQSMDESVSNHASISTLSTYDQSSRIITILARKVSQLILLREYICFVSLFWLSQSSSSYPPNTSCRFRIQFPYFPTPTCPPLNSTVFSSLPLSVQWSFLIMTADRSVTLFFILQSFWWFDR